MARESEGGARLRTGRSSASLDPNRSTVRRSAGRRVPRGNVRPPVPNASPRNSRVAPAAVPKGPSLLARTWAATQLALVRTYVLVTQRGRLLADYQLPSPSTWILRTVGALLAVGAMFGVARFVQSHLTSAPAFAIDMIDVQGLQRVDREELLAAGGVKLGQNVFAQRPEDIQARLLKHPWILSAQVTRELPSHLKMVVRERDPVALMVVEACPTSTPKLERGQGDLTDEELGCEEASSLYLISDDGKMFKRLGGRDPVDLPVITGLTRPRMAADPELASRVLGTVIALMHAYRESGIWQQNPLGEIHLESNDGYSLYVGEDLTYVRLGAPPFEQKLRRMKKVFERLSAEKARAEYVYLDNEQRPDRVAVRLR